MTMGSVAGMACSTTELLYLGSLRGGKAIYGIEDPLRGRSELEIEAAFARARGGLLERRYIAHEPDGSWVIDTDVARLVDTVARPRRSFLAYVVSASAADPIEAGVRRVFHVRGSLAVEIVSHGQEVQIEPLAGRDALAPTIAAFWGLGNQVPVSASAVTVSQEAMHTAARVAVEQGYLACEEYLLGTGLDMTGAAAVATTLIDPRANAALLAFDLAGPTGKTLVMGMLEGDSGLWRLRPHSDGGERRVTLTPCGAAQLTGMVRDFVRAASG